VSGPLAKEADELTAARPDRWGGPRRLGAAFLFFLAPSLIAPVVPGYVLDHFRGGDLAVGLAVAAISLPGIVGRPLAGRVVDGRGPGVAFAVGAGAAALAMGVMGLAPILAVFLVLRLVQGSGESLAFVGAAAGTDDGSRGRGMAYTRFATVLTGGTTIGPLLSEVVVARAGTAAVWPAAGGCALAAVVLHPRPTGRRDARATTPRRTVLHRPSLLAGLGMGLGNLGFGALAGWAVLLAESRDARVPGLVLSSFAAWLTVGRLAGAGLPDRWGPRPTIVASAVVSAAGLAGMAVAPSAPWLAAAAGVLGLGSALLMPALLAEAVERAGAERRGQVVGTIVGGYDACAVVGAVALGAVASLWGYPAVFLASAFATLASIPVFAAWRARAERPALEGEDRDP
jgi:MFS family permease